MFCDGNCVTRCVFMCCRSNQSRRNTRLTIQCGLLIMPNTIPSLPISIGKYQRHSHCHHHLENHQICATHESEGVNTSVKVYLSLIIIAFFLVLSLFFVFHIRWVINSMIDNIVIIIANITILIRRNNKKSHTCMRALFSFIFFKNFMRYMKYWFNTDNVIAYVSRLNEWYVHVIDYIID